MISSPRDQMLLQTRSSGVQENVGSSERAWGTKRGPGFWASSHTLSDRRTSSFSVGAKQQVFVLFISFASCQLLDLWIFHRLMHGWGNVVQQAYLWGPFLHPVRNHSRSPNWRIFRLYCPMRFCKWSGVSGNGFLGLSKYWWNWIVL